MGARTPVSGIRYASLSDSPDEGVASGNMGADLDHIVIPKYANTGARDTANPSPTEGDMCYITGKGYYFYSGTWCGPYQFQNSNGTWTPVWSTSSGLHTPSIGNGTYAGSWYTRYGAVVNFNFNVAFGSTTNFGGGGSGDNWLFTLPVPANPTIQGIIGICHIHISDAASVMGRTGIDSSGKMYLVVGSGRVDGGTVVHGGEVDSTSPSTWNTTASVFATGSYLVGV